MIPVSDDSVIALTHEDGRTGAALQLQDESFGLQSY